MIHESQFLLRISAGYVWPHYSSYSPGRSEFCRFAFVTEPACVHCLVSQKPHQVNCRTKEALSAANKETTHGFQSGDFLREGECIPFVWG